MLIVLLESKNIDQETLRITKDEDAGKYLINRGKEAEGEHLKLEIKGSYDDLGTALGVYGGLLQGFVKDLDGGEKKDIRETDLIELSSIADKLDATFSQAYFIQFNELRETIAKETGLSMPEINKRAREYRENRSTR